MKTKNMIITFILIIFSSHSFAIGLGGGMGSGGGKAVACFRSVGIAAEVKENDGVIPSKYLNKISFLETLDLFHAKLTNDENMMRISPLESYKLFLNRIVELVQKVNPFFAREILRSRKELDQRIVHFDPNPVEMTSDENYDGPPLIDYCALTNVAVQQWDDTVDGFRLHIDLRLFSHVLFSEESRAILLLHEYLYYIARSKGERDSRSTRDLISAVLGKTEGDDLEAIIERFIY